MTMPLILVLVMVVLYAGGVYLLLDRSLTRVLLGFLLVGNATNLLLFLSSGGFGVAPIFGTANAIVITFGVSAFMLALIYRSWRLSRQDEEDSVRIEEQELGLAEADDFTTEEVTDVDLAETQEFAKSENEVEEER